jgi:glycosyltransferase involved in cell wall biosynthesis
LVYNNEKYVKDAVLSALDQTYSPLEIVISDDGSKDRSFEIIQEIIANYSGPHKIILNRNPKNLGICGQINKLVSLSHGHFLVMFAGDDISKPFRVERIQKHIQNTDIKFLTSDYYLFDDESGKKTLYSGKDVNTDNINRFLSEQNVTGATEAFSRDLFTIFGNLDEANFIEDRALAFRGFLLKKVSYLYEATIDYRVHYTNASRAKNLHENHVLKRQFDKWYPSTDMLYNQFLIDLNTAYNKGFVNEEEYENIKFKLIKLKNKNKVSYELDLYWLRCLQNANFIKLFFNGLKAGLPLKFIIWRFIKRIKSGYNL